MNQSPIPQDVLAELTTLADDTERSWPAASFQILADSGVLGAGIPVEFGGAGDTLAMTEAYIDLAAADLTTCFILTQQNSAVSRIVNSENSEMRSHWLPRLATGQSFATVGISHLSTSRQHLRKPPVTVTETADGFRLHGMIPWTTSAPRADVVVAGGVMPDGKEILVAVDTNSSGWQTKPPIEMLALTASETGPVELANLEVGRDCLLAGPVEGVMRSGAGGAGSLTTSALAVGLSQRCVALLSKEAELRDDVSESSNHLHDELSRLKHDLLADDGDRPGTEELRTRANSLALRSSQALMTACKGAGFIQGHPAERAVREAMFFLVWSCPRPVANAAMHEFSCRPFCD